VNLMDALRKSLDAIKKKPAPAPVRLPAAQKKRARA
jgi:non-homologous end joining protein Ku